VWQSKQPFVSGVPHVTVELPWHPEVNAQVEPFVTNV
jgi:hypothetical protein